MGLGGRAICSRSRSLASGVARAAVGGNLTSCHTEQPHMGAERSPWVLLVEALLAVLSSAGPVWLPSPQAGRHRPAAYRRDGAATGFTRSHVLAEIELAAPGSQEAIDMQRVVDAPTRRESGLGRCQTGFSGAVRW